MKIEKVQGWSGYVLYGWIYYLLFMNDSNYRDGVKV